MENEKVLVYLAEILLKSQCYSHFLATESKMWDAAELTMWNHCGADFSEFRSDRLDLFFVVSSTVISLSQFSSRFCTEWRRLIGCLKLQVIFRKRATNYRALLRKMSYENKASHDSTPLCNRDCKKNLGLFSMGRLQQCNHRLQQAFHRLQQYIHRLQQILGLQHILQSPSRVLYP